MVVKHVILDADVLDYLPKHKSQLRTPNLVLFAEQIAAGMTYLESQRYVISSPINLNSSPLFNPIYLL